MQMSSFDPQLFDPSHAICYQIGYYNGKAEWVKDYTVRVGRKLICAVTMLCEVWLSEVWLQSCLHLRSICAQSTPYPHLIHTLFIPLRSDYPERLRR